MTCFFVVVVDIIKTSGKEKALVPTKVEQTGH